MSSLPTIPDRAQREPRQAIPMIVLAALPPGTSTAGVSDLLEYPTTVDDL